MAGKRGRAPGFTMTADHRLKIQNSNILSALIQHAEGTREMSSTQVTAAIALLRKVLPDLAMVEHSGEIQQSYVVRMPLREQDTRTWQQEHAPLIQ